MIARPIWRRLERQTVFRPLAWAEERAGNNNAARMVMIAMTTINSMSVKPGAEADLLYRARSQYMGTLGRFNGKRQRTAALQNLAEEMACARTRQGPGVRLSSAAFLHEPASANLRFGE